MRSRKQQRLVMLVVLGLVAGILAIVVSLYVIRQDDKAEPVMSKINQSDPKPNPPQAAVFDKTQFSFTDPTSIWVITNKLRPLEPRDYVPADLVVPNIPLRVPGNESMQIRKLIQPDLEAMFAAAAADNTPLMLSSGYRSYNYQVTLYNGYAKRDGAAAADTYSARPGYSEHQTGLVLDIEPLNQQCDVDQCFADLPAGKWVAAHAYEYGFLIRYPADKTPITGYTYEPWHVRYIGKELAAELHKQGVETLEEFFGTGAAPNYGS